MTQYCKVGFHGGGGGNHTGIGDYMRRLDEAGIPFCVKSVNNVGLAVEAAQHARNSGVPHNIILRFTQPGGAHDDLPDFALPPEQSAREHWDRVLESLANAPEFEPYKDIIWIEPTNEIDTHTQAEFLGWFSYHISQLANDQGYKVALSGHNAGQPEPEHWRLPGYQAFLRKCSERPDILAVSLHEGKLGDAFAHPETFFPHLVGRFNWLYDACDELGINRPTTFITEWAWSYNHMPGVDMALRDIAWLSELVAKHASLRGVFLWNLGGGPQWADLPNQLQRLIAPLTDYALGASFPDPPIPIPSEELEPVPPPLELPPVEPGPSPEPPPPPPVERGAPRVQYERIYLLLPPRADINWVKAAADATWERHGYTIGKSPDDAGVGDLDSKTVIAINPGEWGPGEDGRGLEGFFQKHYPDVKYQAVEAVTPSELLTIFDR
jgi:hypothetical protein